MSTRKILALLLAVVMICSLFVSPALAAEDEGIVAISDTVGPQFTDVDGHWAESAIKRWAEAGIIEGDGDGTVNPGRNLKRAELATILSRLLGLKERAAADTFSDVAADAWYVDAVLKCAKAGIMQGDGTGKANPESPIDRQQAIVMIGRAVGVKPATGSSLNRFDDGDTVASWAEPYMIALTDMGILNGLPTGEGDGAIIAPTVNIDRASTFALLDKAIAQYITAPCTVTVDDANKFVVINSAAEETGTVTVTGTTAGVVVAVGTTDDVVLDKADVGTLKVDAPVDVIISKGSSVDDLDANAAAKIDNKGAVTNLNTNADDVVFDGNKPAKVNTAEGVEPAKDSKGNEVTNAPSTSGGSSSNTGSTTTYKYNVSIPSVTGGKVTADVTRTNTADTEVTLTVTPNAQTATSLPYVLKSLTVKNGEAEAQNITATKKFTMTDEGTYTVNAVFEQPITKAVMYVANGTDKTAADMEADGYTPAGDVTDETLQRYPYFFVAMTKGADGYTVSEMKLTANGADVTLPWTPAIWKFASAYVGSEKPEIDPNENPDKLNFTGSAATFVLTFKIDTAEYEFSCDYVKPGVDASTLHTVTFKTKAATETTLVSYKAAKDEKVTAPAAPAIDGYYFTGWDTELTDNQFTVGETDATVTAEYVKITDQKVEVRPAGPAGAEAAFSYKDEYIKAGMTMADSTISINGATLIAYLGNAENATNKAYLEQNVGGTNYVYFGVQVNKVDGATKVTEATKTPDFTGKTALSLGTDSVSGDGTDVLGGQLIKYFPMATDTDPVSFLGTAKPAWNRYYLWTDDAGEVKGVTHLMLNLVTEVPKLDVTFKVGDTTVYTAKKAVEYGATELPEEVKTAAAAEIAKKYSNVTIEFGAMTNYTVPVTLTTDVEKLITVTTGTTAFGGDFGNKVTPDAIQSITLGEKNENSQIMVEGELYYTEWPEFSSDQTEQAGYYSALSVPAMEGATVKYNEGAAMSLTEEVPPFVTIMGGADAENFTGKGVKLEIDLDGEGPIEPATYVYNFSAVKAVRWDVRNAVEGSSAVRDNDVNVEYAGNYYANFEVKDEDGEQIKLSQDHVVAILKETEEGNIVQFAMEKVNEGNQTSWVPVGDNAILIDEHDNDDPHDMGMTLKQSETESEQVWYFFVKETVEGKETVKCVKVVFTVPAAPAAQTPDQSGDTASLSVVETEDVAAPAPVVSYKEDDEVPEIPVMD